MTAQASQNPWTKRAMDVAQLLFITFICWLGSNIGSSVTAFSNKLDQVVNSIAEIAAKQAMADRDMAALTQRVGKLEGKTETLEQSLLRLGFKVEQLERESPHGR